MIFARRQAAAAATATTTGQQRGQAAAPPPVPPKRTPRVATVDEADLPELSGAPTEQVVPPHDQYHSGFLKFMTFTTGRKYHKKATFPPNYLKRMIKPHHIVDFFHFEAYGKLDVDYKVDKPLGRRANGVLALKTSISHYMPMRSEWDGTKGNPTRSSEVNKVIAAIRQKECNRNGKASQATRELEEDEFRVCQRILHSLKDFMKGTLKVCMMVLQFHIVARGADVSQLFIHQLEPHPLHDFALQLCVRWSKNVRDERDCPPQIIMGAMDPEFCAMVNLSVYLEEFIHRGHAAAGTFFSAFLNLVQRRWAELRFFFISSGSKACSAGCSSVGSGSDSGVKR